MLGSLVFKAQNFRTLKCERCVLRRLAEQAGLENADKREKVSVFSGLTAFQTEKFRGSEESR